MKKLVLSLVLCVIFYARLDAQTNYTWTGATSSSWNVNTNWLPVGIPGAIDNVNIVAALNNCTLAGNTGVTNVTMTSGTMDLGGFTLTSSGTNVFTNGTIQNGTMSSAAATASTFAATTFAANCTVNITAQTVTINGGTFGGTTTLKQNGAGNSTGTGNATFNGTTTIENSGTGNFRTNANITFNGTTQLKVSNSGYLLLELTGANTYNGNVTMTITNTGTGNLRSCYLGANSFNGNISVENTGTGYIYICENAGASATLANGKTISVGAGGFTNGRLYLQRFTQVGGTAQSMTFTGASYVTFGPNNTFNGSLTVSTIDYYTNSCTYNSDFTWTKTGGNNNAIAGGNTFNGTTTFNNSSPGYQLMGNGVADTYNGDVVANNTGTERIILGYNSLGNVFNGNITVSQSGAGPTGVHIGWNTAGSSSTLANGKTIAIGAGGFSAGPLTLSNLTTGNTAISVATTGSSSFFFTGTNTFGAAVSVTSPDIYVRGATFNGAATFTKTGGGPDHNNGNLNIFNSTCTINQQSNTGYFMLGYASAEQFNDDITVTSTGTGGIYLGYVNGGGTPTLAATKKVQVGGAGFSAGWLYFGAFTQLGNAAMSMTFTGASTYLAFGNNSVIGGNVTATTPSIYFNGATFNGVVDVTKNGAVNDASSGGNTFQGACSITNTGAGYVLLGNGTPDTWNGDVTFTNSGSERILPGWNSAGNQFNGNITVNSTGSSVGINFAANAAATCTLAAGKTISVGGSGFSAGYLILQHFTQNGNAAITLPLGAAANYLQLGPASTFGGSVDATAPNIYPYGATYSGAVTFTKTGGVSNHNNGNLNTFNSTCTINQQSNGGYFMLGYNSAEVFTDNITVTSTGTGGIYLGYSSGTGTPTLSAGKTISVGGTGFSAGFLYFGTFTQLGNAPINLTFTGASATLTFARSSVFGGDFTMTTPSVFFNGATFSGAVTCTKNGAASDASSGGNTFQGVSVFNNTNAGYLLLGSGNPDTWNNDVTFNNSGSERILPCYNSAGNLFNGNITVTNTGSATGINFCSQAASTATLAAGKTISIGAAGINTGYLILQKFTQLGNAAINLTLTGATTYLQVGPSSAIGGNFTAVSPRILLNGCIYSGNVDVTKNGSTGEWSSGGNTFNGTTTINMVGSAFFGFANGSPDIYNGDMIANNNSSDRIIFGNSSAGNQFNGNVTLTQIGASVGIAFGWNATTDITMAAGKAISIGGAGYSVGYLQISRFTQLGNAAINLTLTGTSVLYLGAASAFGGAVNATAPDIWAQGATYNSAVVFTKTGGSNNHNQGILNTFNSTVTINQQSNTGYFMLGYNSADFFSDNITVTSTGTGGVNLGWTGGTGTPTLAAGKTVLIGGAGFSAGSLRFGAFTQLGNAAINLTLTGTAALIVNAIGATPCSFGGSFTTSAPDIYIQGGTFNGATSFTKTGGTNNNNATIQNIFNSTCTINQQSNTGYFMLGYGSNELFNDNITVTSTGTGGIYLGWTAGAQSPTLAAGKTISVGGAGFSAGFLYFNTFTQLGNAAVNLTFTGATTGLYFGRTSVFGGNFTGTAPSILFNGCTFSGTTTFNKTGTPNDAGTGPNVFTGVSNMTNSGSGYLMFGNGSSDQWLTDVTFNNTGSNIIYAAYNAAGNTFGGNVTCNNTGSTGNGSGIRFCEAASASATITGNLIISNNPTSGTNNGFRFAEGNSSAFTVNGTTTINSTGTNPSNYIRFAQGTNSTTTFGGDVSVTNVGNAGGSTNVIHFGYTGSSAFNGNITLANNTGTGVFGIYFGSNNGTSTQADNKTINTGVYSAGLLSIRNFTQSGPTAGNTSNVSITGANFQLQLRGSSFYDNVIGSAQQIDVLNNTFRGTAALTKTTGNANDTWTGGNTFNGTTTITNQSTFILTMANTTADVYNGNVTFVQSNTGALRPNYATNCSYLGNITATAPAATAMTFGGNAGTATMTGGNAQTISITTGNTPIFTNFVVNKSANNVTLNTRINISTALTLTAGNINTTSANILNMNNASTTNIGSAASFVNGPMNYDMALNGARTLTFPIGKLADWRPAVVALTHNAATSYTYKAELFNLSPDTLGWTLPATVDTVSGVHWWDIDRSITGGAASSAANLSGNQQITLYFDVNDYVYQGSTLTIVKNTNGAPTTWIDIGGNCALGNFATPQAGNVTSTSAPSAFNSFSRFTLGSKLTGWNSLPVEFLYFTAKAAGSNVVLDWATATETNNDHFDVERSKDGISFEHVTTVKANGTGNSLITQIYKAVDNMPYTGVSYYRLKQNDKNGAFKYSNLAEVNFTKKSFVNVYPNPVVNSISIDASNDYLNAAVKIINALGEEVGTSTISSYSNQLDVSTLQSGVYYIVIDNGTEVNKTRITVQK